MAKQYSLNTGIKTYATMAKVFREGEVYTEEQVALLLSTQNEQGDNYFVELSEETDLSMEDVLGAAPVKRSLKIGKKIAKPKVTFVTKGDGDVDDLPEPLDEEEGGEEWDGEGEDPDKEVVEI